MTPADVNQINAIQARTGLDTDTIAAAWAEICDTMDMASAVLVVETASVQYLCGMAEQRYAERPDDSTGEANQYPY